VKTDRGVVCEFQHSCLCRDERESREKFYQNMVWVVNGLRRARDRSRFFELLARASIVKAKPLIFTLPLNNCALLRDWVDSRKQVFFDFGDNSEPGDPPSFGGPVLWRLEPRSPKGEAHLSPVLKTSFLDKYRKGLPLKGIDYSEQLRAAYAVKGARGC
jgi:competence protein CoiA